MENLLFLGVPILKHNTVLCLIKWLKVIETFNSKVIVLFNIHEQYQQQTEFSILLFFLLYMQTLK